MRSWADLSTSLSDASSSGIARLAAKDAARAAALAEAACDAPAGKVLRLRLAAATSAESAASAAKVVIADLKQAVGRAEAIGAGLSAGCDLLRVEMSTWEQAFEVADTLRRLAGPGSVEGPKIARLLDRAGMATSAFARWRSRRPPLSLASLRRDPRLRRELIRGALFGAMMFILISADALTNAKPYEPAFLALACAAMGILFGFGLYWFASEKVG